MQKLSKYLVLSALTGFLLQFGAMLFVALFLVWFHDNAKEITSIIGVLTLIIGVAVAHLIAIRIHHFIVRDEKKREVAQKGNNIATVILIVGVPFLVYPYLDWLENNLTQMMYYSSALVAFLVGISLCFFLNFQKMD